ncbi:GFA family protein [Nocardioides albidus]|uniref:GFA family protein n=1 Tax=Nocardioides albidus TaxID=1517589 RepID=A0A5C4WMU5_9ACTN|nr:GFA family protein [Nocardioides albidus]TNM49541.1 GFA family protein [Nocardioides albidus]
MPDPEPRGRCLCGSVAYTVRGALRDVLDCHCARCRRFTGHHMAATSAARADVDIDDAESLLRWYAPVPEASYGFCARCGSSLFWTCTSAPDRLSICAGTLDPPTGLRTTAAWWVSEASDYHVRPDLPEFDTE